MLIVGKLFGIVFDPFNFAILAEEGSELLKRGSYWNFTDVQPTTREVLFSSLGVVGKFYSDLGTVYTMLLFLDCSMS